MAEWKRLPLAAIISFAANGLINAVKHGWQGLVPLVAGLSISGKFLSPSLIIPIIIGVLALIITLSLIHI